MKTRTRFIALGVIVIAAVVLYAACKGNNRTGPAAGSGGSTLAQGEKAKPGDFAPDRFYELRGAALDAQGHLVTIAGLPGGGARIARFAPDGTCLWEHLAPDEAPPEKE